MTDRQSFRRKLSSALQDKEETYQFQTYLLIIVFPFPSQMITAYLRSLKDYLIDIIHLIVGTKALLRLLAGEGNEDRLSAAHALHLASNDPRTTNTQHQLSFIRVYNRIGKLVCLYIK